MTIATFQESVTAGSGPTEAAADGGWAERLIRVDPSASAMELVRRAAMGLGLAALYGLAVGARQGGPALLAHALGVPLGLLLLGLVGAPCLFVFLALMRVDIAGLELLAAFTRGLSSAGLLFAGLAPAAALFVVSSETPQAAGYAVLFGLVLGGGLALGRVTRDILRSAWIPGRLASLYGLGIVGAFAFFAVLLESRIWKAMLPVLGGVS